LELGRDIDPIEEVACGLGAEILSEINLLLGVIDVTLIPLIYGI
jgi:hypothetical protein